MLFLGKCIDCDIGLPGIPRKRFTDNPNRRCRHCWFLFRKSGPKRYPHAEGYVVIRTKEGDFLEHRLVMAHHLGRALRDKEVVHHRDEVRNHNHIFNLELCESAGKHTSKHHYTGRKPSAFVTHNGRTLSYQEWSKETGFSVPTLRDRIIYRQIPPEIAFRLPLHRTLRPQKE